MILARIVYKIAAMQFDRNSYAKAYTGPRYSSMQKTPYGNKSPHSSGPGGYGANRFQDNTRLLDPAELASALRVKNLTRLSEVAGVENLAIALDLPLQRVKQLLTGERFSSEMTHHIEVTLGLNSGFLDQVAPQLDEALMSKLKHPHPSEDPEPEELAVTPVTPAVAVTPSPLTSNEPLPPATTMSAPPASAQPGPVASWSPHPITSEPEVPRVVVKKARRLPSAPATEGPALQVEPSPAISHTPRIFKVESPMTTTVSAESAAKPLFAIRRDNLLLMVSGKGSKVQLATLAGMSSANFSHRLHDRKKLDDKDALLFCKVLGLPSDFLDTPKTLEDIPGHVWETIKKAGTPGIDSEEMLEPAPSIAASAQVPAKATPLKTSVRAKGPKALAPVLKSSLAAPGLARASAEQVSVSPVHAVETQTAAPAVVAPTEAPPKVAEPLRREPAAAPAPQKVSTPPLAQNLERGAVVEALFKKLSQVEAAGELNEKRALSLLQMLVADTAT